MANKGISRRQLLASGAALGASALSSKPFAGVLIPGVARPLVIATGNGLTVKNGGPRTCVEEAFLRITKGEDVLDAVIAGVSIVELDPEDTSVGYGGLPNAQGVVQLDACCMHGRKRRAGGVAAIEGIKTPSLVARAVADLTTHHLLVGKGAQDFARGLGFEVLSDLNTDRSRAAWLEWLRRTDPEHYPNEKDREIAGVENALAMAAEGWMDPEHVYGTINCLGIDRNGDLGGVTTTSGIAFKIPGRVGDSPILGAGLYVDNAIGAAGSTGLGEANLYGLCSFLIVEEMRRGAHPKDAGMEALRRVRSNTVEKRLRTKEGNPNFGLTFYMVDKKGRHAGVTMAGKGITFAVCDEQGPRLEECEPLVV